MTASVPRFKEDVKRLLWLCKQVEKAHVRVELETEATTTLVK